MVSLAGSFGIPERQGTCKHACGLWKDGNFGTGAMANGALSHPVIKSVECRKRFPKDLRLVEGLAWWWKGAGERGGAQ